MPNNSDEILQRVQSLFEQGHFKKVIEILDDNILDTYKDDRLFSIRSMSHYNEAIGFHKENYYEAETNYKEALRFNPNFVSAHNNLGNLYLDNAFDPFSNMDLKPFALLRDARKHFEEGVRIEPDNLKSRKNIVWFLTKYFDKDTDEAIHHSLAAIRINPNDAETHFNLSLIYFNSDNSLFDKAKEHYRKATTLDKNLVQPELDKKFGINREETQKQMEKDLTKNGKTDINADLRRLEYSNQVLTGSTQEIYNDSITKTGGLIDGTLYHLLLINIEGLSETQRDKFLLDYTSMCENTTNELIAMTGFSMKLEMKFASFSDSVDTDNLVTYWSCHQNFTKDNLGAGGVVKAFMNDSLKRENMFGHATAVGMFHNSPNLLKSSESLSNEMKVMKFLLAQDLFSAAISPTVLRENSGLDYAAEYKYRMIFASMLCGISDTIFSLNALYNSFPSMTEILRQKGMNYFMTAQEASSFIRNDINSTNKLKEFFRQLKVLPKSTDISYTKKLKEFIDFKKQEGKWKNWFGCIQFDDYYRFAIS